MPIETIRLADIEKNPYRDLEGHPLRQGQIDHLKASIDSTEFWGGLLVRPHPSKRGRYQLAFGHARWEAAKQAKIKQADFIVRNLDDDAMLRAMADENITQFGRDEYATYREAVTAAVERIMGQMLSGASAKCFALETPEWLSRFTTDIRGGGAPGERIIDRYFNGTLSVGAIRTALQEYRETGRLAAWHAAHNPKASKTTEPPKLNGAALSRFEETSHVQVFADTCKRLGIPPAAQPKIADQVLDVLKEPEPKAQKAKSARATRANKQFARTEQPRHERLTRDNIRRVTTQIVAANSRSRAEREQLEAEAHAISIESALTEMSIGLKRAAKAASDLVGVARAIGGMHVDMTPSARMRLADCRKANQDIETSLREAAGAGLNLRLGGSKNG